MVSCIQDLEIKKALCACASEDHGTCCHWLPVVLEKTKTRAATQSARLSWTDLPNKTANKGGRVRGDPKQRCFIFPGSVSFSFLKALCNNLFKNCCGREVATQIVGTRSRLVRLEGSRMFRITNGIAPA